jgi:predicted dehydrogenase
MSASKQRFIIVGLGNRGRDSFARALLGFPNRGLPTFPERADIVAFVDANIERARTANRVLDTDIPVYADLAAAAAAEPADWAIVTTSDATHADVCEEATALGLNVVVDKPLATSVWECDRIIESARRNDRRVVVGHNLRYNEHMLKLAQMVRAGCIGTVRQIEAAEVLDLSHGGSYFHRWHSEFAQSAGLMNHKCCHQLDIINWVLDDTPAAASAIGSRTYYVPRPDSGAGTRCSDCAIAADCPHFCNIDADYPGGRSLDAARLRRMYVDVEQVDGYIRDACVFSDRNTINDQEVVNIRYKSGALCSFSLVTFAPREYAYFYFTGDKGRLEYRVDFEPATRMADDHGGAELGVFANAGEPLIRLFHPDGAVEQIDVEPLHAGFGHGGADVKLVADILDVPIAGVDPSQQATPEQARNAVAIADMAARSIAAGGRLVSIEETGSDFPPAPPAV